MFEKRTKRWGSEQVVFYGPYIVKRLVINGVTSMHYHNAKTETIIVEHGTLYVDTPDKTHVLEPGDTLTLYENQRHSMRGLDAVYIECSTPQLYDSVRVATCSSCGYDDVFSVPNSEPPQFFCRGCNENFTLE